MKTDIEIVDASTRGRIQHVLYVDGGRKATVTVAPSGDVVLAWEVYGPHLWDQGGRQLLMGLLELGVLADQLAARQRKKSSHEET